MPAEPSPEPMPSGAVSAAATPGALPVSRSTAAPRTERELNSPSPRSLGFLGVVFLATFLSWAAAKIACNVRDAPVRLPPELSSEVLSKQPKDAALELQQRAASGQYREAAEFARGDASRELLEADARCQTEPQPCAALRARAGRVATRAVLVGRGARSAEARAESHVDGQVERYTMQLEADGGRWYVVSRHPYPGELTTPVPVIPLLTAPPGAVPEGPAGKSPPPLSSANPSVSSPPPPGK